MQIKHRNALFLWVSTVLLPIIFSAKSLDFLPQSFRNLSAIGAEKHIFSAFFPQNFYGPQSPLKSLKVLENP